MGDAIDDIVGGMNFDADKKDVKAKVFCSVCHVGITEQHLTIRVGGKDVGPMHVKCFKCYACGAHIGLGKYSVRDGLPICLNCR